MRKKAIEMSFNWLFAIIAGIAILGLSIYGVTKITGTGNKIVSTESAAKFTALLDPSQAGIAYGKVSAPIRFNKEVKIEFSCNINDNPPFGKQSMKFAQESFGKTSEFSEPIDIINNYVFSENIIEGKTIYSYSKGFYLPFKIADIIIISSNEYCFIDSPKIVKEDLENLQNINFTENINECGEKIKVCFIKGTGGNFNSGCDIKVKDGTLDNSFKYGFVEKEGKSVYYYDSLIYGAIMSSKEIYECNLKRLINKFKVVSDLYIKKISILERSGCSSNILSQLNNMKESAESFKFSEDLQDRYLISNAYNIDLQNSKASCKLYEI